MIHVLLFRIEKMKKYLFIWICLWHIIVVSYAEPAVRKSLDINIVGHVLNKDTKEHLPYISISLKGTTVGTMTDGLRD